MYVMHHPRKWEDYLPLVEFSYKIGYHESLKMSPFEALYGRKCNIPISWDNVVDWITLVPHMLKKIELEVANIKHNYKVAQDMNKSYTDKNITLRDFKVGEHVYLWINLNRSSLRMRTCSQLAPRYCEPFEIIERVGQVA